VKIFQVEVLARLKVITQTLQLGENHSQDSSARLVATSPIKKETNENKHICQLRSMQLQKEVKSNP